MSKRNVPLNGLLWLLGFLVVVALQLFTVYGAVLASHAVWSQPTPFWRGLYMLLVLPALVAYVFFCRHQVRNARDAVAHAGRYEVSKAWFVCKVFSFALALCGMLGMILTGLVGDWRASLLYLVLALEFAAFWFATGSTVARLGRIATVH